jgi:hypothetical protein
LALCREIGNHSVRRREANLGEGGNVLMCRKVLITLGILCFLSCAKAKADDAYAYCPLGEGYVFLYDSPTGFQVIANLKCGAKLTVVDASDKDRTRVRTADGKEGYVLKSSITVPPSSAQQRPTPSPNTPAQQPQLPPPPKPVSQPQPQPQPKAQTQPEPPAPPKPQSDMQSQAQPQPAQAPPAQAQPVPEQPKQPEPKALPESQPAQPEPPSPPKPQPQLEARSEPVAPITPEPKPEKQPKPKAQPKPKPEPEPKAEVKSQSNTQQPPQPEPAATGFTPFSSLGYEQNVPRLEVYGGLGYLNTGTSALAARQNVLGFDGSVAVHINRWIAGEGNFSGYYKTIQILSVGTFPFHDYLMMGGPRFNIRKAFFHGLVGIDRLAGNWNFYAFNGTTPKNVLAGAAGGGVQWNISRRLALRTSGDYVLTRFGTLTQNNFRVTLGIVFQQGSVRSE